MYGVEGILGEQPPSPCNGKAVRWESNQGGIADCWADKALGLTTSVF